MASRGVHFALSKFDLKRLLAIADPEALVDFISEDLEERYLDDDKWSFQLDKAWDALHRSLTGGQLLYATGPFPLAYAVLGGRPLDAGDDYTACLVGPTQVARVAPALAKVTEAWLRPRYFSLDPKAYGSPLTEEDFQYTWESFEGLPSSSLARPRPNERCSSPPIASHAPIGSDVADVRTSESAGSMALRRRSK